VPVYRLGAECVFPPASLAEPSGLVAVGGDLRPERLLEAYAHGIFPWYEVPPILWFSPEPRAVLRPARLHVPRRLERTLRRGRFALRLDTAFGAVIRACAEPRSGSRGTWITADMVRAYEALHALGFAHSAEAFEDGALVGGVYGVALGSAFFAESMFHRRSDAAKAALVALVRQLAAWGIRLVDAQLPAPHLTALGFESWSRARYLRALARALALPTRPGPWRLEAVEPGTLVREVR
jgi:leucyl/phenylalanyl-tRNA--protein transferase